MSREWYQLRITSTAPAFSNGTKVIREKPCESCGHFAMFPFFDPNCADIRDEELHFHAATFPEADLLLAREPWGPVQRRHEGRQEILMRRSLYMELQLRKLKGLSWRALVRLDAE